MGKIKKFKQFTSGILIGAMSFSGGGGVLTVFATGQETEVTTYKQEPMRLWYDEPAPKSPEYPTGTANRDGWEKWALPIGNGHMGGMVFGGVGEERIQFNEKTLWNGKCEGFGEAFDEYGNRKEAYKSLQQIQEKLRNGEDVGGLLGQLTGPYAPSGSYQSFGNIYLDFGMTAEQERSVVDYVRDLNLDTATANVEYTYNGVGYQREYFVSYPNNIMVMHLTADEANQLTFDVRATADSLEKNYEMTTEENTLVIRGQVKDNEMVFESQIKVIPTGGTVETVVEGKDSKVAIKDADEVLILMAAGTNYLNEFPTYRGVDPHDQVVKRLNLATAKGYEKLKTDHLADYQSIFKRVKLDLGESVPNKTTDELLNNYKRGANSTYLETLLFQYGRYLLIASSREGSLPANLQGIWNDMSNPPWNSDYHINVNLQMNYWPAYVTNMAECAVPLVEYIDSLREPGRITAAQYANIVSDEENPENGWMAHTQNRPFGFTTPGWSFYWGWSPSANAWIVQNVWEYHEFQDDDAYLATTIYPILRETAVFWKQFLIEDPISGRLVSSPSYSPEHGPVSVGNTFDQTLVWQLFTDTIIAANELGIDQKLVKELEEMLPRLEPLHIGNKGQIKEWYEEDLPGWTNAGVESQHRHISHLLGLYPGDLITKDTPEYMEAAKVTLNDRGNGGTGWSKANKINLWARTLDGNRSYILLQELIKNSILTNLWDTHPPMQIDGNFGATSGIAEMLIQSHLGYIQPLPALPSAWATGSITGLVARGNFEVDMAWQEGTMVEMKVLSNKGNVCEIEYPNLSKAVITTVDGTPVEVIAIDEHKIRFNTTSGENYLITQIPGKPLQAPQNIMAKIKENTKTLLEWDVVLGATGYEVYRSEDGTNYLAVGNTLVNSYADTTVDNLSKDYTYKVCAIKDDVKGDLSEAATTLDVKVEGYVDDRDVRVEFKGTWSKYNESAHYKGTVTHTAQHPNPEADWVEFTFQGNGIELVSQKTTGSGRADIYLDGELVVDDQEFYNNPSLYQQVIYKRTDLEYGIHTIKVVPTNTNNGSTHMGFSQIYIDAFIVHQPEVMGIVEVLNPETKQVPVGTGIEEIELPEKVEVRLMDGDKVELMVDWDISTYDGTKEGHYTLPGVLTLVEGVENPKGVKAEIIIEVGEKQAYEIRVELESKKEVTGGEDIQVDLFIDEMKESIYAGDFILKYDSEVVTLDRVKASAPSMMVKQQEIQPGVVRILTAIEGGALERAQIISMNFKTIEQEKDQVVNVQVNESIFGSVNEGTGSIWKGTATSQSIFVKGGGEGEGEIGNGDINQDGIEDVSDLALIAYYYQETPESPNWNQAKIADVNGDKVINLLDLTIVANKILDK